MSKKGALRLLLIALFTVLLGASASAADEMRGVWIASVYNIDFPSAQGLSAGVQADELDDIVENAADLDLNAVFFQVRPSGDALYDSDIFPTSRYLSGSQGRDNDEGFDPLAYLIERADEEGIEVHAWINPLRITTSGTDIQNLASGNPARQDPDLAVAYDGALYYDPGLPEVRELIIDGAVELAENYDIAGIHFDDYFYPGDDFDDDSSFARYGGRLSLDDWRRDNINTLIEGVHEAVEDVDSRLQFGVSPFGVWASDDEMEGGSATSGGLSTYVHHYADTRLWVEEGYVDYIAPQLYWSIGYAPADFEVLLAWWEGVCRDSDVDLFIGHAAYKVGDGSQAAAWLQPEQLPTQIELVQQSDVAQGSIYYGYDALVQNTLGIAGYLRDGELSQAPEASDESPLLPIRDLTLSISIPNSAVSTASANYSILGTSDPALPLLCNGKAIDRTAEGYFAYYAPLSSGLNTFVFTQGSLEETVRITRTQAAARAAARAAVQAAAAQAAAAM